MKSAKMGLREVMGRRKEPTEEEEDEEEEEEEELESDMAFRGVLEAF